MRTNVSGSIKDEGMRHYVKKVNMQCAQCSSEVNETVKIDKNAE